MLCLVLEYLAETGELPPFTRAYPGSSVELIAEPSDVGADDTRTALMLVRGAPRAAIDGFVAELTRKQAPVTTLRRDVEQGFWFGRATFHVSRFLSPSARAVGHLLGMLGPPWIHIEHGVVHLRARVRDPDQAEDVLHLADEALTAAGVEGQVVVQEIAPKDHSVWDALVQRSLGTAL